MKYEKNQTVYVNNKPVTFLAEIDDLESAVLVESGDDSRETVIVLNRKIRPNKIDFNEEFDRAESELKAKLRGLENESRQKVLDEQKQIDQIKARLKKLGPLELLLDLIEGKELWAVVQEYSTPKLMKVSEISYKENQYDREPQLNAFVVNREKEKLEWLIQVDRYSDGSGSKYRAELFEDYESAKASWVKSMLTGLSDSNSYYHRVSEEEIIKHGVTEPKILEFIANQKKKEEERKLKEIQETEKKLMEMKQKIS